MGSGSHARSPGCRPMDDTSDGGNTAGPDGKELQYMCGIAGVISRKALADDYKPALAAMKNALIHRGPDQEGQYESPHVVLGVRRLSIIDLQGGNQPLYNENGSVVLVANAEIYNFRDLREELESRGHRFRSNSDCETILHLYEDFGAACVNHLRGMFAFAIFDRDRRMIMLARDRMGEKPLYLYETPGRIVFASELKALLQSGLVPFDLDPVGVDLFFHYQYVPEPRTPLKGVRKLDAAHILMVNIHEWRIDESCYWRMEDSPPLEGNPVARIREELDTIAELVIRSDVPVGVALSGGVDSSAVASLAVSKYPGTLQAFCVGYPGKPHYDERQDAQDMAEHLGIPFHHVELDVSSMVSVFPRMVYWRDDPIADISGHGYYWVMRLAREHGVPVVLLGHGGDELFWGYDWVRRAVRLSKKKAWLLENGGAHIAAYFGLDLPKRISREDISQLVRSLAGFRSVWLAMRAHKVSPADQLVFCNITEDFAAASRTRFDYYSPKLADAVRESRAGELFTLSQPWPDLDVPMTRLICDSYLRENGIAQGDRLSMASSVESRLPLVDYRLVETVIGLRKFQSDLPLPEKAWFKAAVKDIVPDWVLHRSKKGFRPPVREWHSALFRAYGSDLVDGYLVSADVLSRKGALKLAKGRFPMNQIAPFSFKALVLEQWCRQMAGLVN